MATHQKYKHITHKTRLVLFFFNQILINNQQELKSSLGYLSEN